MTASLSRSRPKIHRNIVLLVFVVALGVVPFLDFFSSEVPWYYNYLRLLVPLFLFLFPFLILLVQLSIGGRAQTYYGRAFRNSVIAIVVFWLLGVGPGLVLPPGSWSGVGIALFSPLLWLVVIYTSWPKKRDKIKGEEGAE